MSRLVERSVRVGERGSTVFVVLPGDIDDPAQVSGGNNYDRRVCTGLVGAGWQVAEFAVSGSWPRPEPAARAELAAVLAAVPDDALVLLDGLVACAVPDLVAPHADRLRLIVLVHLPLADETGLTPPEADLLDERERRTLHAASAVIATSERTGRRLVEHHGMPASRVQVVTPGVDPAPLARGTDGASHLLCVAAVRPRKGHDVLVEALSTIVDEHWTCVCVGDLNRTDGFVADLRQSIATYGLDDRVRLVGTRVGAELWASYDAADLVVLPSRAEPYGMVVTEALARGIPVLASDVDGVPQAMGLAPDGNRPGLLVPPEDPKALAEALRKWLESPGRRDGLRLAARERRATLPGWPVTARSMADALRVVDRSAA